MPSIPLYQSTQKYTSTEKAPRGPRLPPLALRSLPLRLLLSPFLPFLLLGQFPLLSLPEHFLSLGIVLTRRRRLLSLDLQRRAQTRLEEEPTGDVAGCVAGYRRG